MRALRDLIARQQQGERARERRVGSARHELAAAHDVDAHGAQVDDVAWAAVLDAQRAPDHERHELLVERLIEHDGTCVWSRYKQSSVAVR